MVSFSKVNVPLTPVRRLFRGSFDRKSAVPSLGKRGRTDENDTPSARQPKSPVNDYCLALLNDVPADDAIVVTALTTVPFCCHADLLTMPRPQLLGVACALNAHLPVALHIDANPTRPDAYIRSAIEILVGLRPSAPKPPTRARSLNVGAQESPLARRKLRRPLSAVNEDAVGDETGEDEFVLQPLTKRRRVDDSEDTSRQSTAEKPIAHGDRKSFHFDPAFVTTTRPRRRYRPKGYGQTSMPRKTGAGKKAGAEDGNESELTFGIEGLALGPSVSEPILPMDASF